MGDMEVFDKKYFASPENNFTGYKFEMQYLANSQIKALFNQIVRHGGGISKESPLIVRFMVKHFFPFPDCKDMKGQEYKHTLYNTWVMSSNLPDLIVKNDNYKINFGEGIIFLQEQKKTREGNIVLNEFPRIDTFAFYDSNSDKINSLFDKEGLDRKLYTNYFELKNR